MNSRAGTGGAACSITARMRLMTRWRRGNCPFQRPWTNGPRQAYTAAGVPVESIAPPDASGFRNRTMEFVGWSKNTGYHALVYLRARNGASSPANPSFYRWYCYLNTKTLEFEQDIQLQSANEELRTRWNSGDESLNANKVQLRATGEQGGLFARLRRWLHSPMIRSTPLTRRCSSAFRKNWRKRSGPSNESGSRIAKRLPGCIRCNAGRDLRMRFSKRGRFLATHLRAEGFARGSDRRSRRTEFRGAG